MKTMQDDCNQQFTQNRLLLMQALSDVMISELKSVNKSIKLFSREYEFSDGQISKLLRCKYSDIKLSTIWKFANAVNIPPEVFIKKIKNKLPKNFNFYD